MVEQAELRLFFKACQDGMIEFLEKLVRLESPSSNKAAVDKCTVCVAGELKKTGAKITYYPQKETGDFCLAEYTFADPKKTKKPILILTHSDTVWDQGMIKEIPFRISGGKAYGPGVLDMKAGLVMIVFALKAIHKLDIQPQKNIAVFINSCEEIGTSDSKKRIAALAKTSACVLCLEPSLPGGVLKTQRKGRLVAKISITGKAAHAGQPEKGINAIEEIMLHLGSLSKLRNKSVSVNIGVIQGGRKANIVADSAEATLDFRFWNNSQKDKILQKLKLLKPFHEGAKLNIEIISSAPPMEKTKVSANLFKKIKNIALTLGEELEAGKTGGGSDASLAAQLGIPTIDGLGPDGAGIHTKHESLLISSLIQRSILLVEILRTL